MRKRPGAGGGDKLRAKDARPCAPQRASHRPTPWLTVAHSCRVDASSEGQATMAGRVTDARRMARLRYTTCCTTAISAAIHPTGSDAATPSRKPDLRPLLAVPPAPQQGPLTFRPVDDRQCQLTGGDIDRKPTPGPPAAGALSLKLRSGQPSRPSASLSRLRTPHAS
jgi:hypothetical protein